MQRLVALFPPGDFTVERYYSRWLYPILQANLTSLSNRLPIALFDVAIVVFILIAIGIWTWSIRLARKKQAIRSLWRGLVATLTLLAVVYLWFLAAWGLNYARPPLESTLQYDASRITPEAVRALAEYSIDRGQSRRTRAGHAAGFPAIHDSPQIADRRAASGGEGARTAAADGDGHAEVVDLHAVLSRIRRQRQLGPFFLETLLNPDLTGPERPAVLAHEWAHLSGYAPESDASFVGLLAALRAGPAAEYSAWLDLVSESVNQLQPVTQRIVLEKLAQGPRDDQARDPRAAQDAGAARRAGRVVVVRSHAEIARRRRGREELQSRD